MLHYIYVHSPTVFGLVLLICAVALTVFHRLAKSYKFESTFIKLCIIGFVGVIVYATLLSRDTDETTRGFSPIPFITYHIARTQNVEYFRTAFMNVALFFPLGCLMNCLDFQRKKKWLYPAITGLMISITVEISQYIFGLGYTETDDVIHNTLGTLIGVLVCTMTNHIIDEVKNIIYDKNDSR